MGKKLSSEKTVNNELDSMAQIKIDYCIIGAGIAGFSTPLRNQLFYLFSHSPTKLNHSTK